MASQIFPPHVHAGFLRTGLVFFAALFGCLAQTSAPDAHRGASVVSAMSEHAAVQLGGKENAPTLSEHAR